MSFPRFQNGDLPVNTLPETISESALEANRRRAVASRTADPSFVYAVVTTGVYCQPDCPSRRPLRRNVRFFAHGAQAAAAGFRPCKRCRP